jgi:hypothetical protein
MHVPRTVISNEPLDAISTSSDLSHSSTFLPPELIVDLKTFISAAADINTPAACAPQNAQVISDHDGFVEERLE